MRVLFDVAHPAHVHLFKNAIRELERQGDTTHVTSRDKEVTIDLLDAYDVEHVKLSSQGSGPVGLALEWLRREYRLLREARRFGPDVVVSHINPAAAHVSSLLGCPNLVFNDNEKAARLLGYAVHPFSDFVCTPASFTVNVGPNQRSYDGFHELAYLHPNRFDPDPEALTRHGIDPVDPYSVVRLVSWEAYHDAGRRGLSEEGRRRLLSLLDDHGDVYISSETLLPTEFEPYRLPVPPEAIHHLLAFADLYVGDSHTMAIEAGLLGTPSVRFNFLVEGGDLGGYTLLGDTYRLVYSTEDEADGLSEVRSLLTDEGTGERWARRRSRLLDDMIDVTDYMLSLINEAVEASDPRGDGGTIATRS